LNQAATLAASDKDKKRILSSKIPATFLFNFQYLFTRLQLRLLPEPPPKPDQQKKHFYCGIGQVNRQNNLPGYVINIYGCENKHITKQHQRQTGLRPLPDRSGQHSQTTRGNEQATRFYHPDTGLGAGSRHQTFYLQQRPDSRKKVKQTLHAQ